MSKVYLLRAKSGSDGLDLGGDEKVVNTDKARVGSLTISFC